MSKLSDSSAMINSFFISNKLCLQENLITLKIYIILYKDENFYTSKSIFLNCKFDNNNLLI